MREWTKLKPRGLEGLCDEVTFCWDPQEEMEKEMVTHSSNLAWEIPWRGWGGCRLQRVRQRLSNYTRSCWPFCGNSVPHGGTTTGKEPEWDWAEGGQGGWGTGGKGGPRKGRRRRLAGGARPGSVSPAVLFYSKTFNWGNHFKFTKSC